MEFEWNKAGVEPGKEAILENMFLTVGWPLWHQRQKKRWRGQTGPACGPVTANDHRLKVCLSETCILGVGWGTRKTEQSTTCNRVPSLFHGDFWQLTPLSQTTPAVFKLGTKQSPRIANPPTLEIPTALLAWQSP